MFWPPFGRSTDWKGGETLRQALPPGATVAPEWLGRWVPDEGFERYGERREEYRWPKERPDREALGVQIGRDGDRLLGQVYSPRAPAGLRPVPAVETMRQVGLQPYDPQDDPVRLREREGSPPQAQRILSPYDPPARLSRQRTSEWTGYKVHITQTWDEEGPSRIPPSASS